MEKELNIAAILKDKPKDKIMVSYFWRMYI